MSNVNAVSLAGNQFYFLPNPLCECASKGEPNKMCKSNHRGSWCSCAPKGAPGGWIPTPTDLAQYPCMCRMITPIFAEAQSADVTVMIDGKLFRVSVRRV